MASCCLIKWRDAHEPMNAGFCCEQAVSVFAFNSARNVLQTSFLGWLIIDDLGFEAALFGPFQIHSQQHLSPILRFSASCAWMNCADSVELIVFAGQQHRSLRLAPIVTAPLK